MSHHDSSNKKVAVILIPIPGMGHLVAMVELAKHLVLHRSTADGDPELTFIILNMQPFAPNPQISSYVTSVSSCHPDITFVDLPKVEAPPAPSPESFMAAVVELHKPLVRNALQDVRIPVAALVLDLFCTEMIDLAKDLDVPSYIFFTSGASIFGLLLHTPSFAPQLPAADQYAGKTVDFPGFSKPLPLMSMPEPMMDPDNLARHLVIGRMASRYTEATGILINTFSELQADTMKAINDGLYHLKAQAVYAVGPILSLEPKGDNKGDGEANGSHNCLRWLDNQPPASVIFLCFGSMGSFPTAQTREIAAGLERSGQRFLWVLRSPAAQPQQTPDKAQGATQRMATPVDAILEEVLPEGFLERTSNRGMVWPSFAPQAQILAHAAIGGFVTHCGWNSCLESIWYGVPMAAWPLYAEQHFNGYEMVSEMGVAVEVRNDRKRGNFATAEEVERAVNLLMAQEEGGKVREKAMQMKSMARSAVDKGGSSFLALDKFVQQLIR